MRIDIDRENSTPLYRQIAGRIREMILSGELGPGQRLPAERELARALGVNRSTVVNAYDQLRASDMVVSRFGRGTRVVVRPTRRARSGPGEAPRLPWRHIYSAMAARTRGPVLRDLLEATGRRDLVSFAAGMPSPDFFPLEAFREIQDQVLKDHGRVALQHSPCPGTGRHLPYGRCPGQTRAVEQASRSDACRTAVLGLSWVDFRT